MSLDRFIDAQAGGVAERALAEVREGRKTSHWMWFVFPQLVGLGRSPTAQYYGIATLAEARDYLDHPLLGERLRVMVEALPEENAEGVFGPVDTMKLRSSLTLFEAAGGGAAFTHALDRLFAGERDPETLRRLPPQG